uniref:Lon N-terminal domain-containing protein n=1 Tax=Leersia perrieri TaxID=77586 RepID=A0A0D9VV59_9ORYZ
MYGTIYTPKWLSLSHASLFACLSLCLGFWDLGLLLSSSVVALKERKKVQQYCVGERGIKEFIIRPSKRKKELNLINYMALKALQVPSSFASPINRSFISSPSHFRPNPPSAAALGLAARIGGERRRSPAVERRAGGNPHGCVDDGAAVAPSSRRRQEQTAEEILPIVAVPSVVFPGATVQLQAFEFRYRIMANTLLHEGLTTFGLVYSGGGGGDAAVAVGEVGCVAHVVECERLVDGRFFLTCVAGDRFRVVASVRTKPYAVARVQPLTEGEIGGGDEGTLLRRLVERVEEQVGNVARLSEKLGWRTTPSPSPPWRGMRTAAWVSFAVAREMVEERGEQQALLRMDDAAARLEREGIYLERRSRYLAAVAAIKDAIGHLLCCNDKQQ